MLTIHDFANATFQPWPGSDHLPEAATWIDANRPTAEEIAFLERALGVDAADPRANVGNRAFEPVLPARRGDLRHVPLPKREADGEARSSTRSR